MGRERGGFPYLALFAFTVAHQSEDTARKTLQAKSSRKAGGDGETLAKRAGGHFDARAEIRIGMTLQTRTDLAQRLEFLDGKITRLGKRGIKRRSSMTLRHDEAIAVFLAWVFGIVIEHAAEVESGHDVGTR